MVGDVNQKLYLNALPKGVTFTVEEVNPHLASWQKEPHWLDSIDNGWGVYLFGPGGNVMASADRKKENNLETPYEVKPGGQIGRTKFIPGNGVMATGPTGKVNIKFRLDGSVKADDGKDIPIKQYGYLTIGTSDWKGFARPDYSEIVYHLDGGHSTSRKLSVPSSIAGMPDDIHLVLAVDPTSKDIGVGTTTSSDIVSDVTNWVLSGIFFVHGKAIKWAVGKII